MMDDQRYYILDEDSHKTILIGTKKAPEGAEHSYTYSLIWQMLEDCESNLTQLVRVWNRRNPDNKTTVQNLTNKISRDSLRLHEMAEIANILGYSLQLDRVGESDEEISSPETIKRKARTKRTTIVVSKDTGKEFAPGVKLFETANKYVVESERELEKQNEFKKYVAQGFTVAKSKNYGFIVVAGDRCDEAKAFIEQYESENSEIDALSELVIMDTANRKYDVLSRPLIVDDGASFDPFPQL